MSMTTREFSLTLEAVHAAAAIIKKPRWRPSLKYFTEVLVEDLLLLCGCKQPPHQMTLEERDETSRAGYRKHLELLAAVPPRYKPTYPERFSWLDVKGKSYVTPVKNQGLCASCCAFGVVAAVEAAVRITQNVPSGDPSPSPFPLLSEGQIFFCSPGNHSCRTGWTVEEALDYCRDTGVVPEACFPYDMKSTGMAFPASWKDKVTRISGYTPLDDPARMKEWIATKGPLVSFINTPLDFVFYGDGIYHHVVGEKLGGHCICCVGYDDKERAWLCKNSWSSHWGEDGFFWIEYGQCGIDALMWGIDGLAETYRET
jgi:C1A family cysteine protease